MERFRKLLTLNWQNYTMINIKTIIYYKCVRI
uniref:Uncharacterized protein n=1 Tax=Myoviridae sp. ctcyQ27 TaxID=2825139 RepID=A0A8S5UFH0_9CAUD|nr:MAG TPA: hypothetical protein [Myoviridae sp. ctcyQ27]